MPAIDLLDRYPRSARPVEERGRRKLARGGYISLPDSGATNDEILLEQRLLKKAREFGREYFDGDRLFGYGGYYYDPRFWTGTAQRLIEHYNLGGDSCVLEVGCAKGFLLKDLRLALPGLKAYGIDISKYAIEQSPPEVRGRLVQSSAVDSPFGERRFDLVVAVNTIDHLPQEKCRMALREIMRVSKGRAFVSVNAWRDEAQRHRMAKWNLTALTVMHVEEWERMFSATGYTGDYWWFLLE